MFNLFKTYRGLPKSIYILFLAQIINRFGDFVVPFLTLYLTKKLGFSFEASGIIVMIGSLLTIPGSLTGGKLADHFGRKRIYLISQTIAGAFLIPCAFINKPIVIIISLFISTFFNGAVRPPMNAIVADVLLPEKRQLGYSLLYLGTNFGVALGPIVAGFLFNNFLPLLFIGDALTSFIAVILVLINIEETNPEEETHIEEERKEDGNLITVLFRRPQILIFLLIYIIYSFVYTQHRFSLPLMLDYIFTDKGPQRFGYLMSINAFTVLILTIFVTDITKKFKPLVNIVIAGILYAVGFGMIGIIETFSLFIISTVLWTIGEILIVTNFGVYVANNSPQNFRARFSSVGSLSWAVGGALGTSLVGKYIGLKGIVAVWPLTFFLAFISTILMLYLQLYSIKKRRRKLLSNTDVSLLATREK